MARIVICDICGRKINGIRWEFKLTTNDYVANRENDVCGVCANKILDVVNSMKNNKSEEKENSNEEVEKNETPSSIGYPICGCSDNISFF